MSLAELKRIKLTSHYLVYRVLSFSVTFFVFSLKIGLYCKQRLDFCGNTSKRNGERDPIWISPFFTKIISFAAAKSDLASTKYL